MPIVFLAQHQLDWLAKSRILSADRSVASIGS